MTYAIAEIIKRSTSPWGTMTLHGYLSTKDHVNAVIAKVKARPSEGEAVAVVCIGQGIQAYRRWKNYVWGVEVAARRTESGIGTEGPILPLRAAYREHECRALIMDEPFSTGLYIAYFHHLPTDTHWQSVVVEGEDECYDSVCKVAAQINKATPTDDYVAVAGRESLRTKSLQEMVAITEGQLFHKEGTFRCTTQTK